MNAITPGFDRAAAPQHRSLLDTPITVVLSVALIAVILCGLFAYAINFAWGAIESAPALFGLCILTGMLSFFGLLRSLARRESLQFISFLFCFLFFSIAPVAQIAANADPIFRVNNYSLIAAIGGLIFTVMGLFLGRRTVPARRKQAISASAPAPARLYFNYPAVALVTAVCTVAGLAILGHSLFTSRAGFGEEIDKLIGDGPTGLIVEVFLQILPFFGSLVGLRRAWRDRSWGWLGVFLVLYLLGWLLNNPIISARFKVAGLVLSTIDYVFAGRRTTLLALALVVGVVVAPVFNAFRTDHGTASFQANISQGQWFEENFLSMDYDAFETASYAALVVGQYGSQACSNIIGAALFFVPRSIWESKPVPTAWILAFIMKDYRFVGTSNLSTPLTAEAYYGFGWTGLLLISFGYWAGLRWLNERAARDELGAAALSRSVMVGLVLIFLRGTLIVGVSSVVSSLLAALLPFYLGQLDFRPRKSAKPAPEAPPVSPVLATRGGVAVDPGTRGAGWTS